MSTIYRTVHPDAMGVVYSGKKLCPWCKKEFRFTDDWGYRVGNVMYCSYSCTTAAANAGRHYNRTPPEKIEEAIRLGLEGVPVCEIAKRLELNHMTISQLFLRRGIQRTMVGQYRKYNFDLAVITELRAQGMTWAKIGERYGCPGKRAQSWFSKHNGKGKANDAE